MSTKAKSTLADKIAALEAKKKKLVLREEINKKREELKKLK